jgi:diacylglycerol kinase family enzyme
MRERLLFIYNPNAGKAKLKGKLSDIVTEFSENGYEVIVMPTAKRGDATEFAEDYAREGICSRIVCAGGDGTLNEVVTGVMKSGRRVPIGYIPAGTTNDFGYSLKIPKDTIDAAKFAALTEPMPSDVGEICGNTFVYTSAFGLFSDVSYDTPQNMKNILGRVAYLLRGVKSLAEVQNYELNVSYLEVDRGLFEESESSEAQKDMEDAVVNAQVLTDGISQSQPEDFSDRKEELCGREGEEISGRWQLVEGEFICGMVANSNSVGGFKGIMGKDVRFDDGIFEMLLIRRPRNVIELTDIVNELISKKLKSDNIIYAHVQEVKIEAKGELPWSLDGEFGGNMPQAEIHICQRAVDYIRREIE